MSPETLDALKAQNSALYVFQAVRYGPQLNLSRTMAGYGNGYPLVWYRSTAYMANTVIKWDDSPNAYISLTRPGDIGPVEVGDSQPVALGQITEAGDGRLLPPTLNGNPGVVSIISAASGPLSCGLATRSATTVAPFCIFPLNPGAMDMMAPGQQVLVTFAVDQMKEGMQITKTYGDGLLIDFNNEASRSVGFDINSRWNGGGSAWCRTISANADISSLLILPAQP